MDDAGDDAMTREALREAIGASDLGEHLQATLDDLIEPTRISIGWDAAERVPMFAIDARGGIGQRTLARLRAAYNVVGRESDFGWIETLLLRSPLHLRLAPKSRGTIPPLFRVDVRLA